MFRNLSTDKEDQEFADELDSELRKRSLLHYLFGARSSRNVSQKDIAERLGCSQSRVSKIENGLDEDLRLGDFRDYLSALGLKFHLIVSEENLTGIEEIKFHAFRIRHCLDHMVRLAANDPDIGEGVSDAHIETLTNMVRLVVESLSNLPNFPGDLPQILETDDYLEELPQSMQGHTSVA